MDKMQKQRQAMVEQQLRRRGITDERVLAAFRQVPREPFIPAGAQRHAYADRPLPIGHGQTISQPYVVALMLELLGLGADSRVLEVGAGCGYAAALLAELAAAVYAIERLEPLAAATRERLAELGYERIALRHGNGYAGWPEAAPFDGILVSAGAERIPGPLTEQLAVDGRLVIPVGRHRDSQRLLRLTKGADGRITTEDFNYVSFVPLVDDATG
jgi:protein-L-isoaspartate(D-aspartate) O-methyltransferase